MQNPRQSRSAAIRALALSLSLVLTLGCGLHKAVVAVDEGRYDDAMSEYRKALAKDPRNLEAKIGLRRTVTLAAE